MARSNLFAYVCVCCWIFPCVPHSPLSAFTATGSSTFAGRWSHLRIAMPVKKAGKQDTAKNARQQFIPEGATEEWVTGEVEVTHCKS
mmetsp:Transcript_20374/g.36439  ORF Transcript_20374/g.36439 Transcript_20374/m.36439 type:complete len:87 (-) Transcript_20374:234-494(-)